MLDKKIFMSQLLSSCNYRMNEKLLVAVSGGIDSVVLVHLLHSLEIPFEIAHVNYGLRGKESDGDEKFVKAFAAKLGVKFHLKKCLKKEISKKTPNLQEVARDIRYAFFYGILSIEKMRNVATAHHQDDNVETVLLNFVRGTGLKGMTGMKFRAGKIIRPLLNVSRPEIETYAKKQKLKWRKDSSNDEDIYTRNIIRNNFLAEITKRIPQGTKGMLSSIRRFAETDQLLNDASTQWVNDHVRNTDGMQMVSIPELQSKTNLFFFTQWLHKLGFNGTQITAVKDNIKHAKSPFTISTAAHFLNRDRDNFWVGSKAQTNPVKRLIVEEELSKPSFSFLNTTSALVDAERAGEITSRIWQNGDRFIPFGMKGNKNVSDILNEMKVPPHEKKNFQIVTSGGEIVWVPGYRIADKFRVTNETKRMLRIYFE
ncbi:MAG TPA: tRNA lysidine(34) synthetase TilS [Bacteroidia bacterium]|jgi:tRNA(Ile)-lysidine synthase|nr:tRNA lysidine(34) synthetase TilS [Bacteroidia bacterium]